MNEISENISPANGEGSTAWRRIAEAIARDVARGAWSAGEALPPAQDLARQYGVHRHTVRQAYRHLQDLGMLSVQQGRGTFVAGGALPYRIGKRVSFRENLRALDMDARGRVLTYDVTTADHDVARELDLPAGSALWRLRVVSTAGGVPVSASTHRLDSRRFPDFPARLAEAEGSFTAAFKTYGIATYERRSTRISARLATEQEAGDLDLAPGSVVLMSKAVDAVDGRALQAIEAAFRADRIEFVIEGD